MKVSIQNLKIILSTVCATLPMLNGCSFVVAIGKEDPELSTQNPDTDPNNDPLVTAAEPKHPMLKYQDERANRQLRAPWAEKALKARNAQSLIATGNFYSCAQNSAGELKCWGFSSNGSMGKDPSKTDLTNYFEAYTKNLKKISISSGATCVVTGTYTPQCHGASDLIGTGAKENSFKAVVPTGLTNARDLDARGYNFCAIPADGTLKCWGWSFGTTPTDGAGRQQNLLRVTVGTSHHCVLDSEFRALCWGSNSKGQLGLNIEKAKSKTAPVFVENIDQGVIQLAVGSEHTCALMESGGVRCWGANDKGQLGNGTTTDSSIPVAVSGLASGVVAIDAGDAHTCALKDDGAVYCWGDNDKGELGNGNNESQKLPVRVSGIPNGASQFSAGPEHNCILNTAQEAWCWGQGSTFDLLGDGQRKDSSVPVKVIDFAPTTL